jgi:serine/threonine protein kinase
MALNPGPKLDAYEIVAAVGAGGMGEVYKARDTRLNRTVAIKVLLQNAASADLRARFHREAQTIAALNHPHICTLYGTLQYMSPEQLEGKDADARRTSLLSVL